MLKKLCLSNIVLILFTVLFLTPFQLSYADYDSFTVNVPNSQGGYTALDIKKSGNGYVGPKGEYYSQFPTIAQLQVAYGAGPSNPSVVVSAQTNDVQPKKIVEQHSAIMMNTMSFIIMRATGVSILFILAILGLLKTVERESVFFIDRKDRNISAIFGVIMLIAFIVVGIAGRQYEIAFICLFWCVVWNSWMAYRSNPDMKALPLLIGISRTIAVFFVIFIEWYALFFLKGESFALRAGESLPARIDRLQMHKQFPFQMGVGFLTFHDALIGRRIKGD